MGSHAHKKSCLDVLYNNLSFDHLSPGSGAGKAISRNIVLSSAVYFLASPANDCFETLNYLFVPQLLWDYSSGVIWHWATRTLSWYKMPTTSFNAQLMSISSHWAWDCAVINGQHVLQCPINVNYEPLSVGLRWKASATFQTLPRVLHRRHARERVSDRPQSALLSSL